MTKMSVKYSEWCKKFYFLWFSWNSCNKYSWFILFFFLNIDNVYLICHIAQQSNVFSFYYTKLKHSIYQLKIITKTKTIILLILGNKLKFQWYWAKASLLFAFKNSHTCFIFLHSYFTLSYLILHYLNHKVTKLQ